MGKITIRFEGSFGLYETSYTAETAGHAAAIAKAVEALGRELPHAIKQDHRLHRDGNFPHDHFGLSGDNEETEAKTPTIEDWKEMLEKATARIAELEEGRVELEEGGGEGG